VKTGALAAAAIALAVGVAALVWWDAQVRTAGQVPDLDADDRIGAGQAVYAAHCAACHGAHLEGHPNWRERLPNGRLPAPPHDDSGHTWHHPFEVLFAITKHGLAPPLAPQGYQSDMPAFAGRLSDDEIWNVLAYIRSRWSDKVRAAHQALQRRHAESTNR
jgi:mono/diheme cytochrome c family protein